MPASKHVAALLIAAMLITVSVGCETVRFGVSATHDGSTITASYGDGKAVVAAEQDGSRVGLNFRR